MMDVLRPPVIWVGNRCYRKNPVNGNSTLDNEFMEEESFTTEHDEYADEVCDAFTNVEETEAGFRVTMQIPSAFYGFIIGRGGETRRRLENETSTKIEFPKAGQQGDVVIKGKTKKGVLSAKTRVEILADSAKQKQPFSHFLSFPVAGADFKGKLERFKKEVLKECRNDRGVDKTIFQNPLKLHMTIGTLMLTEIREIEKAKDHLEDVFHEKILPIYRNDPLLIHFHGLEYMNDDPSAVDVLYAKGELVDGSDRLQNIADVIVESFTSANLMKKEFDRVKLHVTVMNSLMRKDPSGTLAPRSRNVRARDRESFDARNILKKFSDFDFGIQQIRTIHISQRLATGSDGYYGCEFSVDFPL